MRAKGDSRSKRIVKKGRVFVNGLLPEEESLRLQGEAPHYWIRHDEKGFLFRQHLLEEWPAFPALWLVHLPDTYYTRHR